MYEKNMEKNDEVELDFGRILSELWKRKWIIATVSVCCMILVLLFTLLFVTPQYRCSAMFYVNNSSAAEGANSSITSSDITASKNLVNSYIVILTTRDTLTEILEHSQADLSVSELRSMISAGAVDETEIFRVTVESPSADEAHKLAQAIASVLPQRLASIIEGTSAKVVDVAGKPTSPASPNYATSAVLGFLLGFLVSFGTVVLYAVLDVTVRNEEDVTQVTQLPVLAAVPDMGAVSKGGHEYGADRKKSKAAAMTQQGRKPVMGKDISFAASEAYKLLRTKLQFSFADEESNCRVIGVSSALSGEGKSLSSINLAFTLSEMNKKVILIDCDMRRPTLAEKMGLHRKPGLSSYLTGQSALTGLIQNCGIKGSENAFHVLVAGQNPPNPIELLSSNRMERLLQGLRNLYDYVILDLPPVGEVSDAMAVAQKTDGILLVVRHNYCSRPALADAVRQFSFIDAKLLGVVCNCATESTGKYGKGYYKKYYTNAYRKSNEAKKAGGEK